MNVILVSSYECYLSCVSVGTVYYEMYGMHACKYLCVSVNYKMYGTEAL